MFRLAAVGVVGYFVLRAATSVLISVNVRLAARRTARKVFE